MNRIVAIACALSASACANGSEPAAAHRDRPAVDAVAPLSDDWAAWNKPVTPFRIAGNLYYVGASDVTSYAISTPDGIILIDSGFAQTAPQVVANLKTLGFDIRQVRYILTSQAHSDHVGGIAELKRLSGAKLVMSREDAALAARGGRGDFAFGDRLYYPAAKADRIVADGDTVELGGMRLTANMTPGHTKGCTSWSFDVTEGGATVPALHICGVTAPGYRLVGNAAYPSIVKDFRRSFDRLESMPCTLFLTAHASQFDLERKSAALAAGAATNPFLDPAGCRAFVTSARRALEAEVQRQSNLPPKA